MKITQKFYEDEVEQLNREVNLVRRLDKINSILREYNWVFLHPYSQIMDIGVLENCMQEKSEEKIFKLFATKFLDLRTTICFLEGFYKKRPFLKDYGDIIEQSIILCLQKDFAGAVNVLLPVIEGTLRKYLISKIGDKAKGATKLSVLIEALDFWEKDYLDLQTEYLNTRYSHLPINEFFTSEQLSHINELHRQYFNLWIKQLRDYLKNNLYCDTRSKKSLTDKFNRHLIFHALENEIAYSFRNYLRLINCINFLSWAIGNTIKGCSVLAEVEEEEIRIKWQDYFKILIVSESLTETKTSIYGSELESFKPYLHRKYADLISVSEPRFKALLKLNDVF